MNLKILEVRDGSTPEGEYVHLEVLEDTTLLGYALLDETYNYKGVPKGQPRLFRFPDWEVKKGEQIKLFSGKGRNETKGKTNDPIIHCFYWGMDQCIWNSRRDKAELLYIKSIDKKALS